DALLVAVAMALALGVHDLVRVWLGVVRPPPSFAEYAPVVVLALPWFVILVVALDLHRTFERGWSTVEVVVGLLKLHAVALIGLVLFAFVVAATVNRSLVAFFLVATFLLMLGERLVLLRWRR